MTIIHPFNPEVGPINAGKPLAFLSSDELFELEDVVVNTLMMFNEIHKDLDAGECGGAVERDRERKLSMTWQPIETAPQGQGKVVLTQHERDLYPVAAFCFDDVWFREFEGPEDIHRPGRNERLWRTPTHWMPLPDPPA